MISRKSTSSLNTPAYFIQLGLAVSSWGKEEVATALTTRILTKLQQLVMTAEASGHGEFVLAANFEEAKATIDRVLDLLTA